MAGNFASQQLGGGYVSSALGALLTVPSSNTAYIGDVRFANKDNSAQDVAVYTIIAGVTRLLRRFRLEIGESCSLLAEEPALILNGGHQLMAQSTAANEVSFEISGVLET